MLGFTPWRSVQMSQVDLKWYIRTPPEILPSGHLLGVQLDVSLLLHCSRVCTAKGCRLTGPYRLVFLSEGPLVGCEQGRHCGHLPSLLPSPCHFRLGQLWHTHSLHCCREGICVLLHCRRPSLQLLCLPPTCIHHYLHPHLPGHG